MNNDIDKVTILEVGGKKVAKYIIENDILFLKVIDKLETHKNKTASENEDEIINLIGILQGGFNKVAYLNI